jgi:predicted dehydrogenase
MQIPSSFGSYEELLRDPNVDVIYNSLPNSMHHEWTIRALQAGKHVLCEKPISLNAPQAEEMFDVAEKSGRVLVEAFMYRSHPLTLAVIDAVKAGVIGELRLIRSSFCYRTRKIDGNVRFDKSLGGGSLMDIGCYCINFSRLFANAEPTTIHCAGTLHPTGVDDLAAGVMVFPGNIVSSFTCGMSAHADNTAYLCGTEGYIEIPIPWKPPGRQGRFVITRGITPKMDDANAAAAVPPREVRFVEPGMDLYGIEADDFATTIQENKPPRISREGSVGNMRVLDEMRRQVGVVF